MPTNFLGKNQMAQASFEPGTFRSRVLRSAAAPHWLGSVERGGGARGLSHPSLLGGEMSTNVDGNVAA